MAVSAPALGAVPSFPAFPSAAAGLPATNFGSQLLQAMAQYGPMKTQQQTDQLNLMELKDKVLDEQMQRLLTAVSTNPGLAGNSMVMETVVKNYKMRGLPPPTKVDALGRTVLDTEALGSMAFQQWFNISENAKLWYGWDEGQRAGFLSEHPFMKATEAALSAPQTMPFGGVRSLTKDIADEYMHLGEKGFDTPSILQHLSLFKPTYDQAHGPGSFDRDITPNVVARMSPIATAALQAAQDKHTFSAAQLEKVRQEIVRAQTLDELTQLQKRMDLIKIEFLPQQEQASLDLKIKQAEHLSVTTDQLKKGGSMGQLTAWHNSLQRQLDDAETQRNKYKGEIDLLQSQLNTADGDGSKRKNPDDPTYQLVQQIAADRKTAASYDHLAKVYRKRVDAVTQGYQRAGQEQTTGGPPPADQDVIISLNTAKSRGAAALQGALKQLQQRYGDTYQAMKKNGELEPYGVPR